MNRIILSSSSRAAAVLRMSGNSRNTLLKSAGMSADPKNWQPPHILRASPLRVQPSFFFSSSTSDKLLDMVSREHDEEIANDSTAMPESLQTLKDQMVAKAWKIEDATAMTQMHKTVGDFQVQISFHCQDSTDPMEGEAPEEEEQEEEQEDELAPAIRFTVTATKAGSKSSLVFICVSENSVAYIKNAVMTDTDVQVIHSTGVDEDAYQGPEFTELAEDLQEAFHDFLEADLGVDEDVAAFIAMHFDFQEQCQYVQFLKDAKSILS